MPKDDILSLEQMIFCCCQSLKSSIAKFPETLRLEWSWSPSQLNTWRGEETKINSMIKIFFNTIAISIKCIKLIILIRSDHWHHQDNHHQHQGYQVCDAHRERSWLRASPRTTRDRQQTDRQVYQRWVFVKQMMRTWWRFLYSVSRRWVNLHVWLGKMSSDLNKLWQSCKNCMNSDNSNLTH